jgi:hypothetical protein
MLDEHLIHAVVGSKDLGGGDLEGGAPELSLNFISIDGLTISGLAIDLSTCAHGSRSLTTNNSRAALARGGTS